ERDDRRPAESDEERHRHHEPRLTQCDSADARHSEQNEHLKRHRQSSEREKVARPRSSTSSPPLAEILGESTHRMCPTSHPVRDPVEPGAGEAERARRGIWAKSSQLAGTQCEGIDNLSRPKPKWQMVETQQPCRCASRLSSEAVHPLAVDLGRGSGKRNFFSQFSEEGCRSELCGELTRGGSQHLSGAVAPTLARSRNDLIEHRPVRPAATDLVEREQDRRVFPTGHVIAHTV